MQKLSKSVEVGLPHQEAFNAFVRELTLWWPKTYTWSKDKLIEIGINPIPGGHCTEIGPLDFRCDWGTVTEVKYGSYIAFKWQITASRSPEPDPDKASEVRIRFVPAGDSRSRIELEHDKFENHGEGHETYRAAMDAEQGWDYMLACFEKHARTAKRLTVEVKS
ncbi:SRPBCC family protein [Parapedobacter lycopersici]|uniref:SRPBCC family protein n=1 Tax=Parapedobacter lycopersici TaxID=1864939 RepID=UPI00214DA086|nr:SRPBCC family protein [Parapedobacter lycopersici]